MERLLTKWKTMMHLFVCLIINCFSKSYHVIYKNHQKDQKTVPIKRMPDLNNSQIGCLTLLESKIDNLPHLYKRFKNTNNRNGKIFKRKSCFSEMRSVPKRAPCIQAENSDLCVHN